MALYQGLINTASSTTINHNLMWTFLARIGRVKRPAYLDLWNNEEMFVDDRKVESVLKWAEIARVIRAHSVRNAVFGP